VTLHRVRTVVGGSRPALAARQAASFGRLRAERTALALRQRAAGRPDEASRQGRILTYHSIGTRQWGVNDVTPADFERHLQIAADDGWSFATPAEVLADPQQARLALTFDDGLASVLTNAVPVLRHHGIPASMFVVTGWADRQWADRRQQWVLDWRQLRELQAAGVVIASHSVTHRDFGRLQPHEAGRELEVSRDRLRVMLGVETAEFAIPFGQARSWTDAAAAAAAEAGYTAIYANCVSTRPPGTIPRTFITRMDRPWYFRAALAGAYDDWQEWY
jgi:peptidoglycan/xylan/chitin deacetylase (PgdA/CDA1 family)